MKYNVYSMDCNSRYVFLSFDSIKTKTKTFVRNDM